MFDCHAQPKVQIWSCGTRQPSYISRHVGEARADGNVVCRRNNEEDAKEPMYAHVDVPRDGVAIVGKGHTTSIVDEV